MLIDNPQPINDLIRFDFKESYKRRFRLFVKNRFSGDVNIVQQQSTYLLTSSEAIILELRGIFITAFKVAGFSEEEGKQVARAFKAVLIDFANRE